MGPSIATRAAATQKRRSSGAERDPLLPYHVYQVHRIAPRPIHFPPSASDQPEHYGRHSTPPSTISNRSASGGADSTDTGDYVADARLPGIPKLTRACLAAEIRCYGKYILACLAVFALGGVSLALFLSGRIGHWG